MKIGNMAPPNCPIIIKIDILFFKSGYLTMACDMITGNKLAFPTPTIAINMHKPILVDTK